MRNRVLPDVKNKIQEYRDEHHGASPLYVILPKEDADALLEEVKLEKGYQKDIVVTEYDGTKIITHLSLRSGEVRLTNELPEISS